jgi:phosphate/sulfate permease
MIILVALIVGALLGWRRAVKLGGDKRDRLQYALAFALGFGVLGLFASVIIDRAM